MEPRTVPAPTARAVCPGSRGPPPRRRRSQSNPGLPSASRRAGNVHALIVAAEPARSLHRGTSAPAGSSNIQARSHGDFERLGIHAGR